MKALGERCAGSLETLKITLCSNVDDACLLELVKLDVVEVLSIQNCTLVRTFNDNKINNSTSLGRSRTKGCSRCSRSWALSCAS